MSQVHHTCTLISAIYDLIPWILFKETENPSLMHLVTPWRKNKVVFFSWVSREESKDTFKQNIEAWAQAACLTEMQMQVSTFEHRIIVAELCCNMQPVTFSDGFVVVLLVNLGIFIVINCIIC